MTTKRQIIGIMHNMTIKWTLPTGSGLCDRLLDVMLMSALGKTLNADVYLDWIVGAQAREVSWQREIGDDRKWDKIRYLDYKYENFYQYLILPSNLKINQKLEYYDLVFNSYIGGIYSPHAFYNLFINHCSLDDYLLAFKETMSEFGFTDKLLNMVSHLPNPDISVHLRRADKIRTNSDSSCITKEELNILNDLTMETVDKLKNDNLFFSSDEEEEKVRYESKYLSIKDAYINIKEEYEKTYIDLYLLSVSKYIILSQKHSNFSMLACLIKGSKLIYYYKESVIEEFNFNMLDNIIYYKNL